MTLRVTIDVFSGRPNPEVTVSGAEERDLLARLTGGARAVRGTKASPGRAPVLPPATLGYRGLVIERVGAAGAKAPRTNLPATFRVAAGFIHGARTPMPLRDPAFEDFVCGSTGPFRGLLGPRFPEGFLPEVQRYRELLAKWPRKLMPWPLFLRCACAPLWEPAWWNDGGQVQQHNNCYNYGSNYRTDTFAQPGRASGAMYDFISCAEVKAGAIADGLIDSPTANNKCPKEGHLVALVVSNWDFHWYRKGRNGHWTHKPGSTQATQYDNSGHLITDPRTADRGSYVNFCTFMTVMHGHIKLQ
ncbi:MAG: hypothetical protein U1E73_05400 [Planctomycetota bacterium]